MLRWPMPARRGIISAQSCGAAHGDAAALIRLDLDLRPQAVELQFLQQGAALRQRAIDEDARSVVDDKDIVLDLALRREQGAVGLGAGRQVCGFTGEEVVEEGQGLARKPDDGAGGKNLCCEW